jgi:opacity protein-like surface antigen
MKRILAASFLIAVFAVPVARADEGQAVSKAQAAAKSWLALTDAGKHGASWDDAAAFFKKAVSKADWEKALGQVRGPLGAMKSRKLKSATFTRTLPNAPEGEYVVIQFDTQFEGRAVVETITPMKEKDGSFKVSGYYVK